MIISVKKPFEEGNELDMVPMALCINAEFIFAFKISLTTLDITSWK